MGRVITFAQLPTHTIADGVIRAAITQGETREMAADLVRIDPAKRWAASALAPPLPSARLLAGFRGKIKVAERARTPTVAQPEQKKQRLYFVGHHGAQSQRGHAMIVVYERIR